MWPDEAALEHFLECLSPREQLELWGSVRKMADQGTACTLVGHRERIEELTQYTFRLILGIREAAGKLETVLDGDGHKPGSLAAVALAQELRDLIGERKS